MFIGHYGVAFALKKADPEIPLGLLFFCSQWVDILWSFLVLIGVEQAEIVPGITAANPLDLFYYPYSHSLAAALLWAGAVYLVFRIVPVRTGAKKSRAALVLAMAACSHFALDLLTHRPDLPLLWDNTPKIGLGLWNDVILSYVVEGAIFLGGVWLYLKSTTGTTLVGKYGIIIFAGLLLALFIAGAFAPPPPGPKTLAAMGLGLQFLFTAIADVLDKKRR